MAAMAAAVALRLFDDARRNRKILAGSKKFADDRVDAWVAPIYK